MIASIFKGPRHPNAAAATPLAQVLHPSTSGSASTSLAPNALAPGGKSASTTSLPLPGVGTGAGVGTGGVELEASGVGGGVGGAAGGCSLSGAPLGLSQEESVGMLSGLPASSPPSRPSGPTTARNFGIIISRLVRVLGRSKVHSTSSVTNTGPPGISHRALEKQNKTGGGGRDGSVAANVENRGCLSWGGRSGGFYLWLANGGNRCRCR
ncbi:hypothetical protein DFP72DRAFT_894619 [Ephemerocybe angulata]|uniref:Uncharacterized protein n=1 Tax=Ephemerocybe angulata TaxID=980116 RepID=A0A8H6I001_9AGAR|nr:hypothetical protein DFP72DRAFT_894619 [Tulosesus angulatus]